MSGKISKEDFEKAKRNLQSRDPICDDLEADERAKDEILAMWHKLAQVKVPEPDEDRARRAGRNGEGAMSEWKTIEIITEDSRMPEPTPIDLMLMWLHDSENDLYDGSTNDRMKADIRAILEQQKKLSTLEWRNAVEIDAVRAFVDRVERRARVGDPNYFCERFTRMIGSHLKDMEKANAGTND